MGLIRGGMNMVAPVRSAQVLVSPLGQSTVNVYAPLRSNGQIAVIDTPGEGTCAAVALSAGNGFGRGITSPGVQAEARLQLGSGAAGWKFGFIQFLRFQVLDVVYRGATPADGSLFLQYYSTAEQRQLQLDQADGANAQEPWYHPQAMAMAAANASSVTIPFNDTPADLVECRRANRAVRQFAVDNWLHHIWFSLQFTTVLAAQSPAGAVEPLQAFDWAVDWNLTFTRGAGSNPNEGWTWNPNPVNGRSIGPVSRNHLSRHAPIAARFHGPRFQMLPIVRAAAGHSREPRVVPSQTW